MAKVPENYESDPEEDMTLLSERIKFRSSHKLLTAESNTTAVVSPELPPEIDQEPEELNTQEGNFEEGKPGSAKNVLLGTTRTSDEENPSQTNVGLSSKTEPEIKQLLELETSWGAGEDLEVPINEKHEEPDLQIPAVSVDVLTELPTETNTQLPTEVKIPEAVNNELELPEETGQSLTERDKEIGPEQSTPDFPNRKPRSSIEEDDLSKMGKSESTEKTQEESAEEKSTEPSEVTKPEFPDWKLRKSSKEADLKPPDELQVKSSEHLGTEQPEQVEPKFPDKKQRQSPEEKVTEVLEELKLELSEEESRKPMGEASLELSEKTSSDVPEETRRKTFEEDILEILEETAAGLAEEKQPDVQGETQGKSIVEKVLEPLEDRKPTDQKELLMRSSEKSKSKETLEGSPKGKGPVLQQQTEPEFPKKKLRKSTEGIGQVPPQMTKPEVQEKSQPEPTKDKNLQLSDRDKPKEKESPKKDSLEEPRKLKYPVGKDELIYSENRRKSSEKETNKAKTENAVQSPRESMESFGTYYEIPEVPKEPQADISEQLLTIPASQSGVELSVSVSDKQFVASPQELEDLEEREDKINDSIRPQFEHLQWSPEKVAEWISELGFPQYKECFTTNFISGPKLIHVNCSNLPQMGITDFEDMKKISHHTRELLGITEPLFSRSICLPYRDNIGLFLEQKGHSGLKSDSLTLPEFVKASGLEKYGPEIKAMDRNGDSLSDSHQNENEASLQVTDLDKIYHLTQRKKQWSQ